MNIKPEILQKCIFFFDYFIYFQIDDTIDDNVCSNRLSGLMNVQHVIEEIIDSRGCIVVYDIYCNSDTFFYIKEKLEKYMRDELGNFNYDDTCDV